LRIEPEFSSVSIVLVGNLNPSIFTPDWFARHGLLTEDEVDAAEVEIIHAQITKFNATWLNIMVDTDRFTASTSEPPIQLRDLVVRTFQEQLSHTPLKMLGINREVHFSVGNSDNRTRIGYKLAPPEAWGDWASRVTAASDGVRGGLRSLVMEQQVLDDRSKGHIQSTVQPSAKIRDNKGIYVRVNDHYEVKNKDAVVGSLEIVDCIKNRFESSIATSDWIIDQIMALKET